MKFIEMASFFYDPINILYKQVGEPAMMQALHGLNAAMLIRPDTHMLVELFLD
jgi:hypothetical protein